MRMWKWGILNKISKIKRKKEILKVIIFIGVSLCVLFIVIQIGKNSIIDKTVLKDKDTLAKSIIQDKNALNELIVFLQAFDDTSIVKNSAEKKF